MGKTGYHWAPVGAVCLVAHPMGEPAATPPYPAIFDGRALTNLGLVGIIAGSSTLLVILGH